MNLRKNIFNLLLIFCFFATQAQKKFTTDKGEINFTSNARLELIKASSNQIQGVVDPANGQFAFIVKVKSFVGFNSDLQQEHFNERYMESDKFYDATFSGKILDQIDFTKDGTYDVKAKGILIIHGVKQPRTITSKIQVAKGNLKIVSKFNIPLADHNIKIPTIVSEKIATEIIVDLNFLMVQE